MEFFSWNIPSEWDQTDVIASNCSWLFTPTFAVDKIVDQFHPFSTSGSGQSTNSPWPLSGDCQHTIHGWLTDITNQLKHLKPSVDCPRTAKILSTACDLQQLVKKIEIHPWTVLALCRLGFSSNILTTPLKLGFRHKDLAWHDFPSCFTASVEFIKEILEISRYSWHNMHYSLEQNYLTEFNLIFDEM